MSQGAVAEFPIAGLTDTALEIASRRRDTLLAVKQAIRSQDLQEADRLITELVPDDEKGHSTIARFNRRASRAR